MSQEDHDQALANAPLTRDLDVDVAIVGGGVTGLTLATLLQAAGSNVVVLERRRVGSGTTGSSTAHLTHALDIPFATLQQRFGQADAELVLASVSRAIAWIQETATHDHCAFARVPGFRFSERRQDVEELEKEVRIAADLGLAATFTSNPPLPYRSPGALRIENQALMQPFPYLKTLAEAFGAAGGRIFEDTAVVEAGDGVVRTESGPAVRAEFVVQATHSPIGVAPLFQTRTAPYTSYVLRVKLRTPLAPALFWDCEEPYHYLRPLTAKDGDVALVGGEDHKTGQEPDPASRYASLERWTRERFEVEAVQSRWCHELFESVDGLPYIGRVPGRRNDFVATGYSGTGITFGTVAGLLLRDLILGVENPWERVYRPSRLKPLSSMARFVKENANVATRFVADRLRPATAEDPVSDVPVGSGRLVTVDGRRVAIYRDEDGTLHRLSPNCTHMGCVVQWNGAERTWDCPCHGGRFLATGAVLYGPPVAPLAPLPSEPE